MVKCSTIYLYLVVVIVVGSEKRQMTTKLFYLGIDSASVHFFVSH
ncbi:hypothetical protein VIBNISOn1_1750027 [Vibrio nigripulchritudo SOn1]|uniref:Uncharacterized protein n=1 Tax=Vibrio nigripulchritudo SOn1 TaxID=1238450 RepID=A0AAV2VP80_9VIBR|nr:hypothetical protein VIBNISOn1_1750027 [Vibrio nigripulchritudo SOn1]